MCNVPAQAPLTWCMYKIVFTTSAFDICCYCLFKKGTNSKKRYTSIDTPWNGSQSLSFKKFFQDDHFSYLILICKRFIITLLSSLFTKGALLQEIIFCFRGTCLSITLAQRIEWQKALCFWKTHLLIIFDQADNELAISIHFF